MVGIEAWVILLATHNPWNERFFGAVHEWYLRMMQHRPAGAALLLITKEGVFRRKGRVTRQKFLSYCGF
jgi:hypothetical protein